MCSMRFEHAVEAQKDEAAGFEPVTGLFFKGRILVPGSDLLPYG